MNAAVVHEGLVRAGAVLALDGLHLGVLLARGGDRQAHLADVGVPFELPGRDGPAERLAAAPALRRYHLLRAVRGDLLARLGRSAEAREELPRAADLCGNERERELLLALASGAVSAPRA